MSHTIFTRFLTALGVPHTADYSDEQFRGMTFKSLYGLSHLLTEYGVPNQAMQISDKSEITKLTPPFLAQSNRGIFVIVTDIDAAAGTVSYDSLGQKLTAPLDTFENVWNGVALLAFPQTASREPDYGSHALQQFVLQGSKYVLALFALAVMAYFFITRGVYAHVSTILLTVFDCVGLYFSYLLMQKSLGIHTATSDRVCGVLEKGGCDTVVSLKVSKLFGVFSWSEVGFGYFGVSLATLLVFPHLWPALALWNVCCLPYTFWSIWYQKFRARHWCTLCVGVQSTLWLVFFCWLGGGWFRELLPLRFDYFVLLAVYVVTVLFINLIVRIFKNLPHDEKNS